ncbi:MAG: hypothetical protein J0L84_03385 [Verrucomicrobia bacterium]|nr:hypothetical protein [Verrucomicrobiota bacterium]
MADRIRGRQSGTEAAAVAFVVVAGSDAAESGPEAPPSRRSLSHAYSTVEGRASARVSGSHPLTRIPKPVARSSN